MQKTTILGLAAGLTLGATGFASAQSIHCGSKEGAYTTKVCPAIMDVLRGDPLYFEHAITTSVGTPANIDAVRANPLDLGVGQMNILASNADGLFVVKTGVLECLYVVTSDDELVTATNLSPRLPFGLPPQGSGTTATFMSMSPFSEMRNVTYYESALDAVNAVKNNTVHAAGFVQIPDTSNAVFKAAANLRFVGVINRSMLREQVNGVPLYEGTPNIMVRPGSAWQIIGIGDAAQSITTACTPVVVFGTDPAKLTGTEQLDQQDLVTALEVASKAGKLIPDTGDWRSMFSTLAEGRANLLDAAMQKLEDAGAALN